MPRFDRKGRDIAALFLPVVGPQRGDVVHRSRKVSKGPSEPHPVTRDELLKAIHFLKELVKATKRALQQPRGTDMPASTSERDRV